MTEENIQLFDVLKTAIWGGKSYEQKIHDSIRKELRAQAVEGLTAQIFGESDKLKYLLVSNFIKMASTQEKTILLLQKASITVAVIKGTASGIYYPTPFLRTYGDIDLLVHPSNYREAISVLLAAGYTSDGNIGEYHTALSDGQFLIELHQSIPGINDVAEGKFILRFMLSGLDEIENGVIEEPYCVFPMLPWKQNGLELIWHFREHLYNGIGLRHAIDWMLFVNARLSTEEEFDEFRPVLENSGLLLLARVVARMSQLFLGLTNTINWCKDVDDSICRDLMDFILEQGNFGHKKSDDKASKVLTRYNRPFYFLKGLQSFGTREWGAVQNCSLLRPFAWIYGVIQGIKMYSGRGGMKRLKGDLTEHRNRQKMFEGLYGKKLRNVPMPHVNRED